VLEFWKENLVLLAVPKTGTTAIEKSLSPFADISILNPPGLKHTPVAKFNRFVQPYLESVGSNAMETVGVIRNPLDWLGSWYRYRARPFLDGKPNSTKDVSFDDFVLEVLKEDSAPFARIGSQRRFLSNRDGDVAVTHLFKFEEISAYVRFLEHRLNRKIELGRTNVSPKMEIRLSSSVDAILRDAWAAEFELWESVQASET